MLKFSQFLNEFFAAAPQRNFTGMFPQQLPPKAQLGLMIEPGEEAEYQRIVAQNIDNPETAQTEMSTGELGWQETNAAVANYQKKQLDKMRAQSGL